MQTRALSTLKRKAPREIAGSLCLAVILMLSGDMTATVVRCTMPDGDTEIESLAAAARCRSEFTSVSTAPAATPSSIAATCSDQLLATQYEATANERFDGRVPIHMAVPAPEVFSHRASPVTPAAVHRRSGSEGAIQLLRTVVLQT